MFQGLLKPTALGPEVSHTRVTPGETEAERGTEKQTVAAVWPGPDIVKGAVPREKTREETWELRGRETQRERGR